MSRRRAHLLVDHDLAGDAFVGLLIEAGHDVVTPEAVGLGPRASDEHVLARASTLDRMLITKNVADFRALHFRWQRERRQHGGILEFPRGSVALADAVSAVGGAVRRYQRRELRGKLLRLAAFLPRRRAV